MKVNLPSRASLLWGVMAVVIGLLIAFNPVSSIIISIRLCGTLLLIIGATAVITFIATKNREHKSWTDIPSGGVLATIFGLLLLISPALFVVFFGYLLGAMISVLGISQIIAMRKLRKMGAVIQSTYYILPIILIAVGVVVVCYPIETNAWVAIFAGLWISAFGLSEVLNYFTIKIPEKAESIDPDNSTPNS